MGHASTFHDLVDELALDANTFKKTEKSRFYAFAQSEIFLSVAFFRERNLSENLTTDGSSLSFGAKSKRFSKVFTLEVFKKCPGTDQTVPKSYSAGF